MRIKKGVLLSIMLLLILSVITLGVSHFKYLELLSEKDNLLVLIEQQDSEIQYLSDEIETLNKNKKEVEIKEYSFTQEEIYLIAQVVEAEAGDYENHGNSQKYVCQVILNRLEAGDFPNTIKEVIYQKNGNIPQFSVAYNGMIDGREVSPETLVNVYSVICHGTDLPENVKYFYSASVKENWVNTLNTYIVLEGTVFAYE